ncbi:hypothetical protein EJB05_46736, partial [Eragrostis curvula]
MQLHRTSSPRQRRMPGLEAHRISSMWRTGRGDTTTKSITNKAFHHSETCRNFKCRAWVKLMHPFNVHDFIRSLLIQFNVNNYLQQGGSGGNNVHVLKPDELMKATEGELIMELAKQVTGQRYLLVLEHVPTTSEWDIIKAHLPEGGNGSCIVIDTTEIEIACLCIGHSYRVSELKEFYGSSVCVFFKEHYPYLTAGNHNREVISLMGIASFDNAALGDETAKKVAAIKWIRETNLSQTDPLTLTDLVYKSNVLSVWGIPGVGKSSIVKLVYCQQMCFTGSLGFSDKFNKFGWVNVSHPFDLTDLSQSLLLDLHSESLQYGGMLRIKDPIQMCHQFLQENNCLVVIDGLQSKEEWDLVRAAFFGYKETVIIVITNEESVAAYCAEPERAVFNVKGLDDYGACDLFTMEVKKKNAIQWSWVRSMEQVTEELKRNEEAVKLMVHKCGGLPKVIVELADLMAMRLEDRELWMCLNDSFMQVLEHDRWFPGLQGLFEWVNSYFRSCPDFLKPCIFYLSIFPVSHSIRRRRLVRRWVAEGYARDTKENNAEDTAEDFIFKLVKLSIIQQHINLSPEEAWYTRVPLLPPFLTSTCKANGLFLEYIISRPMEENLVFALQGSCSLNSQHSGRHLTIGRSWDRDESVFEGIDFSRLRSFTVFGEWMPFFITKKMRLLRVLDLEDASSGVTDCELEKILHLLPGLKFLSLRGRKEITRLPDSLGGLRQLQTLDIRGTSIITLPKSIIKLRKLQYVRAGANPPPPPDDDTPAAEATPPPPPPPAVTPPPPAAAAAAATPPPAASPSLSKTTSISKKPAGAKSMLTWLSGFCVCGRIACSHNGGVEVPRGIGEMTALLTFGVIDLSVPMVEDILKELKKLAQLRKLGVCGINKSNVQQFLAAISGHGHLQSLSVHLDKDYQDDCLKDISVPPKNLQTFKLVGLARELPVWIIKLQSLTKLKLQMTKLPQEQIDIIGNLPLLRLLCLCFKEFEHSKLQLRNCFFYKLRVLEIACNSRLTNVELPDRGKAVYLEVLKIRCCGDGVSSVQFDGLNRHRLKEVWITGTYDEAFKRHIQCQVPIILREEDWILGSF